MGIFGGGSSTVDNNRAFQEYANQMRQRGAGWDGWVTTGDNARGQLYDQFGNMINNPNAMQDKIAAGYAMSPYEKYLQDEVTKRMNYNAANTGALNSGGAQTALQQQLTGMTGADMNAYIDRGMNSYGMGLSGMGGLADRGFSARENQDALYGAASGAQLKGQMSANQAHAANATDWGGMIGTLAGTAAGAYFGGPAGAQAGGAMGGQLFGKSGGSGQPMQSGMSGGSDMGQMFPNGGHQWSGWNQAAYSPSGGGMDGGNGGGWGSVNGNDYTNSGNWSF